MAIRGIIDANVWLSRATEQRLRLTDDGLLWQGFDAQAENSSPDFLTVPSCSTSAEDADVTTRTLSTLQAG